MLPANQAIRQKRCKTSGLPVGSAAVQRLKWQILPLPSKGSGAECATDAPVSTCDGNWAAAATCALNARSSQPWPLQHPVSVAFHTDAATTIAGLAGAAWSGSGGVLTPGASAGTGGPVRLHPLRGTQGDHRRKSYPHLLFQLILSHSGWRYAEAPPARPSWPCSRDCPRAFCTGRRTKLAVAKIPGCHGRRKRTRAFTELQSHYLFEDRFGQSRQGQ